MAAKVRALQEWCRRQCDGYRDVVITNMTSSWKSGLAFCAIIHRYRPDLIDYDCLSKEDVFDNNKLAFDVALNRLGIPALLDPEDMVMMAVPDKLCIITYVAQYYNYFHNKPRAGGPAVKTATKRSLGEDLQSTVSQPASQPSSAKISAPSVTVQHVNDASAASHRGGTLDDRCQMCRGRVYLLQRHYTGDGQLCHRHCYRAAQRTPVLHNQSISTPDANKPSSEKSVEITKDAESGGSDVVRDSGLSSKTALSCNSNPSSGLSNNGITASIPSSALMKTLYTVPAYKSTVESTTRAVDRGSTPVTITMRSTPVTPVRNSIPVTSSRELSTVTSRRDVMMGVAGSGHQSAFAAARSQYLQRTGALDAPAVTTTVSISTVSMPTASMPTASVPAHRLARNTASSCSGVSSSSPQSLISSLSARQAPTSNSISTSQTVTSQIRVRSPGNVATSTAAHTAVNCMTTTPRVSSRLTSNSGSYVSPFVKDKIPATTAAVATTAITSATGTYISSRPLTISATRTELLFPSQLNHSKNRHDGAIKQTQTRERRENQSVADQWRAGVSVAGKTDWQLEAERRQAARNGVYIDPEKQRPERRRTLRPQTTLSTSTDGGEPKVATLSAARGLYLQTSSGNSISVTKPVSNTLDGLSIDSDTPPWTRSVAQRSVSRELLSPPSSSVRRTVLSCRPKSQQAATVSAVDGRTLQQRLRHSQSDSLYRRHDRFMSKKSDSSEPAMTVDEITRRLEQLDSALRLVETEGRDLEEKIRKDTDDAMDDDKDSRMVRWFALIKQRNELIREESDLMYRRRQQELEELHEELEYQLRPLLDKPDERKTLKQKQDEERLLTELLEVVSLRNNIVDSIEVDRQRYIEEDQKIEDMILECGLRKGKTRVKGRKKKAKKERRSSASPKRLFHFTSRSSL